MELVSLCSRSQILMSVMNNVLLIGLLCVQTPKILMQHGISLLIDMSKKISLKIKNRKKEFRAKLIVDIHVSM